MITYYIKTWRCSNCDYAQDCEPTQNNQDLHFNKDEKFPAYDILENECPSCVLKGIRSCSMEKVIDISKKSVHNFLEQSDVIKITNELKNEPIRLVATGRNLKVSVKDHNLGNVEAFEDVEEKREETDYERKNRINNTLSKLKPLSIEEINKIREKYEDK